MAENKAYKKRVLIIGEYKAEKAIASSLIKRGCNVTVINENGNDAERLAEINGLNVIFGNGSSKSILLDANVENADMVIAVTESDEKNLVICEICKNEYKVKMP